MPQGRIHIAFNEDSVCLSSRHDLVRYAKAYRARRDGGVILADRDGHTYMLGRHEVPLFTETLNQDVVHDYFAYHKLGDEIFSYDFTCSKGEHPWLPDYLSALFGRDGSR
jgi:hypothetical protein